jgi:hypothetical protein
MRSTLHDAGHERFRAGLAWVQSIHGGTDGITREIIGRSMGL